jgi:hypothetical protein
MKRLIYIIISLVCTSCINDIDLPFEKSDQALVVNCLFSENSDWKVILSRVKSYNDTTETYVDNARVGIVPEGQDTIRLTSENNGVYSAKSLPIKGITYQLVVKDRGKIFRAKNAIPPSVNISSVQVAGEHTVFYSTANLTDYDVVPVKLNVTPTDKQNYVRLRFYSLNTNKIMQYVVTEKTIETLRQKKFSENFLSDLSTLIGKQIKGYDIVTEVYFNIMMKYNMYGDQLYNEVLPAIEKVEVGIRDETTYEIGLIFSNSAWLSNISRDTYNVLGQLNQPKETSIFASYYPVMNKNGSTVYTEEYWLEAVTMSEDYYKYQKSYINQANNISNPFASSSEVYTNIENGVGIFAGYSKQMIHFHDF